MNFIEEKLIILLQNFKSLNFLEYFTRLFDFDLFSLMIVILYLLNLLRCRDLYIIVFGMILLFIIKFRINRKRPFLNNKNIKKIKNFNHPFNFLEKYLNIDSSGYLSFPSGHSFMSELLKLILIYNVESIEIFSWLPKYKNYYDIPLSIFVYFVAFSRVYLGYHYLTDVLFAILFAKIYDVVIGNSIRLFS